MHVLMPRDMAGRDTRSTPLGVKARHMLRMERIWTNCKGGTVMQVGHPFQSFQPGNSSNSAPKVVQEQSHAMRQAV